ncbi:hypothetical protein HDU93_001712, partial [Gonapodya sp. JEL0774]
MSLCPPLQAIEIPLTTEGEDSEVLEVPLADQIEEGFVDDVLPILEQEKSQVSFYLMFALECYKRNQPAMALIFLQKGVEAAVARPPNPPTPSLLLHASLAHHLSVHRVPNLPLFTSSLNTAETIEAKNLITQLVKALNQVGRLGERKPWDESVNRAVGEMGSVVNRYGGCVPAVVGQALIHFYRGDYRSAISLFHLTLLSLPESSSPNPRLGIGMCLLRLGHTNLAKNAFERALDMDGNCHAARGVLMQMEFNEYKRISGDGAQGGHARGKQALDRAMRHLEVLAAADKERTNLTENGVPAPSGPPPPTTGIVSLFKGIIAMARDETDLARTFLRAAHDTSEIAALQAESLFQRGKLSHRAGQYPEAESLYRAAVAKDNKIIKAKVGLARCLVQRGEIGLAAGEIEGVLETRPEDEEVLKVGSSGGTCADEGILAICRRFAPVRISFLQLAISIHALSSDPSRALDKWTTLHRLLARRYENQHGSKHPGPDTDLLDDPELCIELSEVWQKQGNVKSAFVALERALALLESTEGARIPLALFNNLAVLAHLDTSSDENLDRAELYYLRGLSHATSAAEMAGGTMDTTTRDEIITVRYNIARLNEAKGETEKAKNMYKLILEIHPMYADASLRLSAIELSLNNPTV